MADIFLSYARHDRDRARPLAAALQNWWSVWWDPGLLAGQPFREVIQRELKAATCVVVLWSEASVGSNWVLGEASYAREQKKLVPARIDESEIPIDFQQIHTASLVTWDGEPHHALFLDLRRAIVERLGDGEAGPRAVESPGLERLIRSNMLKPTGLLELLLESGALGDADREVLETIRGNQTKRGFLRPREEAFIMERSHELLS